MFADGNVRSSRASRQSLRAAGLPGGGSGPGECRARACRFAREGRKRMNDSPFLSRSAIQAKCRRAGRAERAPGRGSGR
jgi:hypothetical protein